MSNKRNLKAYVRYDGDGRIIPGSLILNRFKPAVGNWKETDAYECCNYTPSSFNLEVFLSRMNSCYGQVTDLIPNIVYFSDGNDDNPSTPTYIEDGCSDMYDAGNLYNTNLTQLYVDAKDNAVSYDLSIPYTHTQQSLYDDCNYTSPPIDGTIVDGSSYFGIGSTYLTNMYPGMFILAASGINVTEFSITGNLGTDGNGTDAVYIQTAHPGWTAFIKTNKDTAVSGGDPSVNHIVLVYGNVSGATQLYDNTGEYDDHCVQGLGSQNTTIITAVVATDSDTPALTEEEALAIANKILDVAYTPCIT